MARQPMSDRLFQEMFDAFVETQLPTASAMPHSEACSERMQGLNSQYATNIAQQTYLAQNIVNIGSAIIKCNQKCRNLEENNEKLYHRIRMMNGVPSNYPLEGSSPASEENHGLLQIEALIELLGTRVKGLTSQLHPKYVREAESQACCVNAAQACSVNAASSSQEYSPLLAVALDPLVVKTSLDGVRELDAEEVAGQFASSAFSSDRFAGTSEVLEYALQVPEFAEQPSNFGSSAHPSEDSPEDTSEVAENIPRRRRKNVNGSVRARRRREKMREARAVTALAREIAAPPRLSSA